MTCSFNVIARRSRRFVNIINATDGVMGGRYGDDSCLRIGAKCVGCGLSGSS